MTALREARLARQWTQARLVHELVRHAATAGLVLPAPTTMKTQLSRWENGRHVPEGTYRRLLRSVYGLEDEQLGFVQPPPVSRPSQLCAPPELMAGFAATLAHYATMDHCAGHSPLLVSVRDQAQYLDALTHQTGGADRAALLRLASRYAEFAGWLHQDAGEVAAAMHWTDRAMDAVQELGDVRAASYVLQRKSNIATDAGRPGSGLGLAEAALRQRELLTPRLRAVGLRQHATACALVGQREDCLRSLGEAVAEVAIERDDADESDVAVYCTSQYIDMEIGNCWLLLGEPAKAVSVLERGLSSWPLGQERDRGLCLSRLAVAHARTGDLDAAAAIGLDAVAAVRRANSARSLDQLRRLRIQLVVSRTVDGVKEFDQAFAALDGGAAA
ncbi:MAG TPA: hypothetical protein VHV82_17575 [Sporichthyaceae bacterium]|nr:hypothetical protein [Sporichthyaceae bacterium]